MRICTRCDRFAPGVVRRALAELPHGGLGWVKGDAMLVASELVTNAVRHSHCHEGQMVTVNLRRAADSLEISVRDPGRCGGQAQPATRPAGAGGLGLKVVEALSDRWGSERRPDGHLVWAQLPLPAAPLRS